MDTTDTKQKPCDLATGDDLGRVTISLQMLNEPALTASGLLDGVVQQPGLGNRILNWRAIHEIQNPMLYDNSFIAQVVELDDGGTALRIWARDDGSSLNETLGSPPGKEIESRWTYKPRG